MKATGYLLQATLISLWWVGLSISDSFFKVFQFPGISSQGFNSFFAPDIIVIVLLSIIRAYRPIRELEYVILGGFAYGTFFCINASIITQGGYLASLVMILGLFYNLFLVFSNQFFRESKSNSSIFNGLKTLMQIIGVWGITLVLFPWLILNAFGDSLIPQLGLPFYLGLTVFLIFSILNLFSAYTMVRDGNGTPLPVDQTTKLVVSGPYHYVRNPMAIAGIGQGIAVSIIYTSVPIFIYALLGAVLWHLVVRPIEEKDMEKRFGQEYNDYRARVSCWIPK